MGKLGTPWLLQPADFALLFAPGRAGPGLGGGEGATHSLLYATMYGGSASLAHSDLLGWSSRVLSPGPAKGQKPEGEGGGDGQREVGSVWIQGASQCAAQGRGSRRKDLIQARLSLPPLRNLCLAPRLTVRAAPVTAQKPREAGLGEGHVGGGSPPCPLLEAATQPMCCCPAPAALLWPLATRQDLSGRPLAPLRPGSSSLARLAGGISIWFSRGFGGACTGGPRPLGQMPSWKEGGTSPPEGGLP